MAANSFKRVLALIALSVLVMSFVVIPTAGNVVLADGASGGHPTIPPPPDSGQYSVQPAPESDPWFETVLLVTGLSSMML